MLRSASSARRAVKRYFQIRRSKQVEYAEFCIRSAANYGLTSRGLILEEWDQDLKEAYISSLIKRGYTVTSVFEDWKDENGKVTPGDVEVHYVSW